ncbi:DNA-binding protein [Rahnella victoriana]|uniref:helix-turn-helix domain-containing protein n=1 Tax=Rahnella victoriana TaxID=1510570 RepID=UPI000BB16D6A|nr:helix-turn-helix domain-containing protein [Rahnella victoriana]PBI78607.1 DNA-binding protein [Rahnella victoriana]
MSMGLMVQAMKIRVGNPLRKLVLLKLADNASDKGECWPSLQHIADQCEISRRSVINHIDALCELGLLKKELRPGVKGNSSNLYYLTLDGAGDSLGGSAGDSLPSAARSPYGAGNSLGGGAGDSPRISHSFESVNEPVSEPKTIGASGDEPPANKNKNAYPEEFEKAWKAYPAREGSNPKNSAYSAWNARNREGVDPETMLAGVIRYATFCQAKGQTGTTFVMQGQRFFGKAREFENTWIVAGQSQRAGRNDTHSGFDSRDYGDSQINF